MSANKPDYLIFLHIPKTAGSTMRDILSELYGENHTVLRVRGLFKKSYIDLNSQVNLLLATLPSYVGTQVLSGHIPYGLHQRLEGTCEYFTFIRHPVDYVLSMYYFNLQFIRNGMTPLDPDGEYTLDWMLDQWKGTQFNNYQARFLASQNNCFELVTAQASDNNTLYRSACRIVHNDINFVFPVDQFDVALRLLGKNYGWKYGSYRQRRVNRARPRDQYISDDLKQRILLDNSADMQLYLLAQQRLEKLKSEFMPL